MVYYRPDQFENLLSLNKTRQDITTLSSLLQQCSLRMRSIGVEACISLHVDAGFKAPLSFSPGFSTTDAKARKGPQCTA